MEVIFRSRCRGFFLGWASWGGGWLLQALLAAGPLAALAQDAPLGRGLTFNRDVAPIVFSQCTPCHRTGQPVPFPFMSYDDVRRRVKEARDVIERGVMPPWPPEAGCGDFAGGRRLSAGEKQVLCAWIDSGMAEGAPEDLPPLPQYKDGWTLGQPDMVLTMPRPYALGADGSDVYRNFVVPVPSGVDRFVRAVEFQPGNGRVVHHAFIKLDAKRSARKLDGRDGQPGFDGMRVAAEMPEGQFLTWHPGEMPAESPSGGAWRLPGGSDLVLQLHLSRTGKPEEVQPAIGLYFTDQAPTNYLTKLVLTSMALEFPPGASNVVVTNSLRLPVDAEVLSVLPHAHYLAREMECFAERPDGSRVWLLRIRNWDFRWQGSYRYSAPVPLPKGSAVRLRFTYDNSTNNLANPFHPPRRVLYGPQSTDEMCEFWLQVQVKPADAKVLRRDSGQRLREVFLEGARHRVRLFPSSPEAHVELGTLFSDDPGRAIPEFQKAIELDANYEPAHYQLGVTYRASAQFPKAKQELEAALRLNPQDARAWGHLGFVQAELGDAGQAERCFRAALAINPDDEIVRDSLEELLEVMRKRGNPPPK